MVREVLVVAALSKVLAKLMEVCDVLL